MSKRFKSEHDLDDLRYGIDLLNYMNIHKLDDELHVDYSTIINLLTTGLLNKIDRLEDRIAQLEVGK